MGDPGLEIPRTSGHKEAKGMPYHQVLRCSSYVSTHGEGAVTKAIMQAQMGAGVDINTEVEDNILLSLLMSHLMCPCFAPDAHYWSNIL